MLYLWTLESRGNKYIVTKRGPNMDPWGMPQLIETEAVSYLDTKDWGKPV